MDKVRFGIVGLGNMGTSHAKSFLENKIEDAVFTAACDNNPKKIEWAKNNLTNEIVYFENVTDMIKSGLIDAIIIAVPHYSHPSIAMEAFENKINVMCEKPAGVYTKQVIEMNDASKNSDVVFGMMFNQRTNSVFIKMKEMVSSGELGNIRRINWLITNWYRPQFYYDSGDWRATWSGEGGGVLLNQCPHNLDLLQWICGMPKKIRAYCHEGKWHDIEVEDDVTAYAEYENGATAVFITSTGDTPGTNRFEITGDLGKLVCEDDKLVFFRLEKSEQQFSKENTLNAFASPKYEKIEVETDGSNPQHVGVLQAFTNKILGRGELIADGIEGINGLMLSNAMHLSSWLEKEVELPVCPDLFLEKLNEKIKTSKTKKPVENFAVSDLSETYSGN